jgi:hypothetical protein
MQADRDVQHRAGQLLRDYTASTMPATCDSQRLLTAGVRRVDPVTPRSSALTPALPTSSNRVTQFFVLVQKSPF